MRIFTITLVVLGILYLIGFGLFLASADAHESNGWKHAKDGTGLIYGARDCGMGITVLYQDSDGDGKADYCTGMLLAHGWIHLKPYKSIMVPDYRYQEWDRLKFECTCEPEDYKKNLGNLIDFY